MSCKFDQISLPACHGFYFALFRAIKYSYCIYMCLNCSGLNKENIHGLCLAALPSRSRYASIQPPLCQMPRGHKGECTEYPYLKHLSSAFPNVAKKIVRDATMTTGAAWKSEKAGPNRILRWIALLPPDTLLKVSPEICSSDPSILIKLKEKAATYEDCMGVAKKLAWLVYQMNGAPSPDRETQTYLEDFFSTMNRQTTCLVCRAPLEFSLFNEAKRGRAPIETAHAIPRQHNALNVGFAHRECNIAQGAKTLDEFYAWISEIIQRIER
jgi:hypothetical protein